MYRRWTYRDQIVTMQVTQYDVGVFLHSKTHPLFSNMAQCYAISYIPVSKLVSCAFSAIPIKEFFIYLLRTWSHPEFLNNDKLTSHFQILTLTFTIAVLLGNYLILGCQDNILTFDCRDHVLRNACTRVATSLFSGETIWEGKMHLLQLNKVMVILLLYMHAMKESGQWKSFPCLMQN